MANPDPGGSSSDLVNLQENLHQQQVCFYASNLNIVLCDFNG